MRLERFLLWLPLVGAAACSPGIVILSATRHCWGVARLCSEWSMLLELLTSEALVLLPLTILVIRGLQGGLRQFLRTRQAVGQLLALPRSALPPQLARLAGDLGLRRRLDLVDCPTPEAFCYGLLNPRVCLTTGLLNLLSLAEVEAVLRHERHHLRRRDPLRTLLWTALDHACWWLQHGGEQARLQRELAADRAVIAAGGRLSLASALLKLIGQPRGTQFTGLAISGLSVTNARIDQLLHPEHAIVPYMPIWPWLVLPAAIVATTLLCAR